MFQLHCVFTGSFINKCTLVLPVLWKFVVRKLRSTWFSCVLLEASCWTPFHIFSSCWLTGMTHIPWTKVEIGYIPVLCVCMCRISGTTQPFALLAGACRLLSAAPLLMSSCHRFGRQRSEVFVPLPELKPRIPHMLGKCVKHNTVESLISMTPLTGKRRIIRKGGWEKWQ